MLTNHIKDDSLTEMIKYYQNKDKNELHLKGYIYDSLVYRYQLARFSQADYEAKENEKSMQESRNRAVRDIMRFIQILDEAVGEHD